MHRFNLSTVVAKFFQILVFPLCLLSVATASYATDLTIQGLVLEKGSRKPLSGAYIAVREREEITAISDDNGHYELALPDAGRYTLTAATLGGVTPVNIIIDLKPGTPVPSPTFYLSSATQLEEVVVRAARSPDRVGKTVITGAELRRIPGSSGDPLKSIQALPGVVTGNNGGAPAVRGSGPGDNLYYVDSLPIGKIFHFGGISVFNADLIQDFNLYSAAFAPRYGDATGAVIDVALRDPRSDRLGGKLNVNLLGSDFLVEGPLAQNHSFYFAARRSYFDLLVKQISTQGLTIQIPNFNDYQGKYLWKINATDRLTLETQGAADELKISVGSDSDTAKQEPILTGDLAFSDGYAMQAIVWDALLGNTQNKLAYEHIAFHFDNSLGQAGTIAVGQDSNSVRELVKIPLSENHELTLGGNLSRAQHIVNANFVNSTCTGLQADCDLSTAPKVQLNETFYTNAWEVSVQNRRRIFSKLTLVGGLHYTANDYQNRASTEPRVGAEWDWSEATLLTAGWGQHSQMPSGQQISKKFGNPDLEYLKAEHAVLGISQKLAYDWSWKAEGYYKKFSNLVLGVPDTNINYVNGASGKAYGTELLIKKDGLSDLTGWLAISLSNSERRNDLTGDSFRFEYDQPINVTLITNYKLNDNWTMGAKWNYHSGTPYTPVLGATPDSTGRYIPVYAAVNSGTLPDYHRLDLRFDRNFVFDKWKLNTYFELNNVYFQENLSGYRYDATYAKKEPVYPLVIPFSFGIQGEF